MGFFQQVWYHRLGTPTEQDFYELGKELPRIAEIQLEAAEDGRYVLASVKNGDGGEAEFFVRDARGWKQISKFADQLQQAVVGLDGAGYFLSRQGAPKGRGLRIPFDAPQLSNAREVVPQGDGAITGFLPTAQKLYVRDLLGGPTRVRAFPLAGGAPELVDVPEVASVYEMARLHGGEVLLDVATYLTPAAFIRVGAKGEVTKTRLAVTSPADFSDCEVVRDFAVSKDGTRLPLNIIRRKRLQLNGRNPALLYGYGGYGISESPSFSAGRQVWIDARGVYVTANVRGGGEYGEAWHKAGNLTRKQNVFDDFYAVAQYLVAHKYTDKGAPGDLYSPYHQVKKGTAILLTTGANDPRVEPWHARKMAARLQAANAAKTPLLLRTSSSSGHGVGSSLAERISLLTDYYSFFFAALGIDCCVEMKTVGR